MEPEMGRNRILEKRAQKQLGCVTGFFWIFGRQYALNKKNQHRSPVVEYSSELERSVLSSTDFDDLDPKISCLSPLSIKSSCTARRPQALEATTPAKALPSASGYEFNEMGRSTWKFRESARLSLDSRESVNVRKNLLPTQIRETEDGVEKQRKSTSVFARLMGLETLPGLDSDFAKTMNPELRRSASESKVCKDISMLQCIGGVNSSQKHSDIAETEAARSSPHNRSDNVVVKKMTEAEEEPQQRRISSFESTDIEEPLMDLETLKPVFEALQLKGLLRKTEKANVSESSSREQNEPSARSSPRPQRKAKLDRESFPATRQRNPRRSATPRKDEELPTERSISRSPRKKKIQPMATTLEASSMSAETAFSDPESVKFEEDKRSVMGRCDMLLQSLAEFHSMSKRHKQEGQPSPVSVLDSSFYNDDSSSSPSPVIMKRSIAFANARADFDNDQWTPATSPISDDPDFIYISEVFSSLNETGIFGCSEQQNRIKTSNTDSCKNTPLPRKLVFDMTTELIKKHAQLPEWKMAASPTPPPLAVIRSEFKKIRDRESEEDDDLLKLICNLLQEDLSNDVASALHGAVANCGGRRPNHLQRTHRGHTSRSRWEIFLLFTTSALQKTCVLNFPALFL